MIEDVFVIAGVFLLAGTVKGVIGLGLPTVSLGLLTAFSGLETAMALMLAPSFVTNLWQAVSGGNGRAALRKIWPFLAMATVAILPGVAIATHWDSNVLTMILAILLVIYGVSGLTRPALKLPPHWDRWAGPLGGGINGILTGLTGSFVVPGALYLQARLESRDELIQAMGILFTVSTGTLALALLWQGKLLPDVGVASALSVVPAIAGMVAGRAIRQRLSETAFRKVFFAVLIVLGAYLFIPPLLL